MRRILALALLAPGLLLGCDRTEEPRSRTVHEAKTAASEPATPTPPPSAGAAQAPSQPACMIPSPDAAPTEAQPAASCPPDPLEAPPTLPRARIVFKDAPDRPSVTVERAMSNEVRMRGLMYRTSMPEEAGMLFTWEESRPRSFWMRNTCIPLDMLFVDEQGFIAGILEEVPPLTETSRRNPCPVPHVLEVNGGYCRRHGIRAGQRIDIIEERP